MAQVSNSVKKCADILKSAKTDTEKLAGLFIVTKVLKEGDINSEARKLLLESIGIKFLMRLMLSSDVPSDCPPEIYKSVALSILSCFCRDQNLVSHPDMLTCIPVFLEIAKKSDDNPEGDLIVVSEAYECLLCFICNDAGRTALFNAGAVDILSEIYFNQCFESDKALNVLVELISMTGPSVWDSDNLKTFHTLLNKISIDFETDHSERKFELCDYMRKILLSGPESVSSSSEDEFWPMSIQKGLSDILTSKVGRAQRDPALMLASAMIEVLGVSWTLSDDEKSKKFLLLLIHLCCVEVRMQLEDRSFKEIMKNSPLIISCFILLESCVKYIATDVLELDTKEKQQLYVALKGALSAVITVLNKASGTSEQCAREEKVFLCAMIRVLASWLAQETSAMRSAVYQVLPFVLNLSNETFYAYRSSYLARKAVQAGASPCRDPIASDPLASSDLLRLLLPALCHLTVEDGARKILIDSKEFEVLLECMSFHWTIVDYKKPVIPKAERLKALKQPAPPIPAEVLKDMKDSRSALISMCNIFMNVTALETKIVDENPMFEKLMKFILDNLAELKNSSENLVLNGNMTVLGLLLLKQQYSKVNKNDFTFCRFIQSSIRFLWDAYNVDESTDRSTLVVSMLYKEYWLELMELWFLGMQTMSALIKLVPWISDFAIESGWAQGIIDSLKKVRSHTLPSNTKAAYEDLLCSLVEVNNDVSKALKEHNALAVCRTHRLMELGKRLFGD